MIHILDARIDALEWGIQVGVEINRKWLQNLIDKRSCYRQP